MVIGAVSDRPLQRDRIEGVDQSTRVIRVAGRAPAEDRAGRDEQDHDRRASHDP